MRLTLDCQGPVLGVLKSIEVDLSASFCCSQQMTLENVRTSLPLVAANKHLITPSRLAYTPVSP
jgi:hypothetical protein